MNIPKIIEAVGNIDDRYLNEAEQPQRKHFRFKPTLLVAIIGIIAFSTGAAALNYTDYTAVNKKADNILVGHYDPQDSLDDNNEPPADTGESALDYCNEESSESAAVISYISYTSGLERMKYSLDRSSGLQNESPFTEEETSPEFTDLTPVRDVDYNYYYRKFGEEIPDPAEFPWLENFEEYGVELENEGEFMTGDLRVTAVMCDDHYFNAVIQCALPEKVKKAIEDLPKGAYLTFRDFGIIDSFGSDGGVNMISLEGNVLTFSLYEKGFLSLPDEVSLKLKDLEYRSVKNILDTDILYRLDENITIPAEKIKKMDNRVSKVVTYSAKPKDVFITAELSPFGIMFKLTSENRYALRAIHEDKYFGVNNLRIYLDDGRIYGSGETFFALKYVMGGKSGFAENTDDINPANDIYYINLPFVKAADIQRIEKISIGGYEFTFED